MSNQVPFPGAPQQSTGTTATPSATPPPPTTPPPASSGGGAKLKILGGCGAAGCLGLVVVAVIGVILLYVFSSGGDDPRSSPGPGYGPQPAPSVRPGPGPSKTSGALSGFAPARVGSYGLVSASRQTELVQKGAADALLLKYRAGSSGNRNMGSDQASTGSSSVAEVSMLVVAMSSESGALGFLRGFGQAMSNKGAKVTEEQQMSGGGTTIGYNGGSSGTAGLVVTAGKVALVTIVPAGEIRAAFDFYQQYVDSVKANNR